MPQPGGTSEVGRSTWLMRRQRWRVQRPSRARTSPLRRQTASPAPLSAVASPLRKCACTVASLQALRYQRRRWRQRVSTSAHSKRHAEAAEEQAQAQRAADAEMCRAAKAARVASAAAAPAIGPKTREHENTTWRATSQGCQLAQSPKHEKTRKHGKHTRRLAVARGRTSLASEQSCLLQFQRQLQGTATQALRRAHLYHGDSTACHQSLREPHTPYFSLHQSGRMRPMLWSTFSDGCGAAVVCAPVTAYSPARYSPEALARLKIKRSRSKRSCCLHRCERDG